MVHIGLPMEVSSPMFLAGTTSNEDQILNNHSMESKRHEIKVFYTSYPMMLHIVIVITLMEFTTSNLGAIWMD